MDKPGQKFNRPLKNDPLLRFYKSLYMQRPDSEMASKWLLEHGVFSRAKAEQLTAKNKNKKKSSSS